ncbi:MAG: NGG1p interacting factor NIF3 [Candidatus Omnitrophica bacterium]|nr:NGG1p interacting factor NIF3 [Candidatus Omnitrophota bacterium]
MKLSEFYNLVVRSGRECDPRSKKTKITSYADSGILYGKPDTAVSKVLVGIDIEVPELLLADAVRSREGLDLVLAHHPEGTAYAGLFNVMKLQVDLLKKAGISLKVAEELLDERMREVERRLAPANHMRAVDAARLLKLPFMCAHTPADNHAAYYLDRLLKRKKPSTIKDIITILLEEPEYQLAEKESMGPRIIIGNPHRRVGEVFLEMTGGTEGPQGVYEPLYKAGMRTIVAMHLSEEHFKKVKDSGLSVVIAGHVSSDTLGLNLLLDKIEKRHPLTVRNCSGFRRFKRN